VDRPTVPVIDLGGAFAPPSVEIVAAVAAAAETFGFFQIVNHGISPAQLAGVWDATHSFFAQSMDQKRQILRTKENSRGYYDRELTKNARDLKEVLDIAHVPHPELADDHPTNFHTVDGVNQWPDLEGFRTTFVEYLQACERLSHWLLQAFCRGLGEHADHLASSFGDEHTSFVRLNYYPLHDPLDETEAVAVTALGDMALQHHSDAGALTLLVQDDVGGLQVEHNGSWIDVEPIEGAIVINTGDMMQVWSNDRYQAALHRVAPRTDRVRYSLPYFFNPSYSTDYFPLGGSIGVGDSPRYASINWGDFRQARADGDFADYGAEVQISDFRQGPA
jgi:isopenicillin N synthase-like dioxygenase